jgi:hypothetical protein
MTNKEDPSRDVLTEELRAVAREQARDAERWWEGVDSGNASLLPKGSPPLEALRPIDDHERVQIATALFGEQRAPRRRWLWVVSASSVAIAATIAAIALRVPTPIADYTMNVQGGDRAWRSNDALLPTIPQYRSGSRLEVVLQPETVVEGSLEVSAELVGKRTVAWPTPIERGRGGTFRLIADVGSELILEPGAWKLVVRVGGPDNSGQSLEYHFEVVDGS